MLRFSRIASTILSHAGIKGFSTQKLTWGSANGIPFKVGTWIGPDGSSVLAALDPGSYTGNIDDDLSKDETWLNRINENGGKSGVYADYHYYGTGDRGGAPSRSSVDWMEKSLASNGPVRVISSKADQIFKDITPEMATKLPTYTGELLLINHSAGSINSQAYMKRWNRKNEQLANAAESAATAAYLLKAFPYPADALYRAWDLVLGSQMHDIMPGTSLPQAYGYSWNDEVLALNQFASVTEHSTAAVLSTMDTTAQGVPIAVYNPLSISREDTVEASIPLNGGPAPNSVTAYDSHGNPVPTQILDRNVNSLKVLFVAKTPSVGYSVYDLRSGGSTPTTGLSVTQDTLENARYRVKVDANGDIGSIFDKTLNRELLASPARLSIHYENPSQYPAWNMDWNDRQKPARGYVTGPAKIRIVEAGPARVALEVTRMAENSVFRQQIRLSAGSGGDRLEILDNIDWRSSEASLKADFSVAPGNPDETCDDKVGVLRRDNNTDRHFENPQQQWTDLTSVDKSYGVAILNDSKYGSDKPDDHTMRLTLLFTPGTRAGFQDQGSQDQGRHEILYALAGHGGDWVEGQIPWQAARLNQPLRAFLPTKHTGPFGRAFSLASLNSDQVKIESIKKAEDSDEVVVLLRELTGKPADGLTIGFPMAIAAAREVDSQERFIKDATVEDGKLSFSVKPFSLHSFALKLANAPVVAPAVTSQSAILAYDTDVVSTRANRKDGAMDGEGGTYPAELFPGKLNREGVEFQLGPTADGEKNAVTAAGQTIELPTGTFNRVHLLAAADGDETSTIKIGENTRPFVVPNWTGFVGQWDSRLWNQPIPEISYNVDQVNVGLVPGFIKRTPLAWYVTHHHLPDGDAYYAYSYLFELSYDLPLGARSITLPNDAKIRVFAVSASREPGATPTAAPLYDTLADHQPGGAPLIPQAGQIFHKATDIVIVPPLYHRLGDIRYTTDGSDPTANSPIYDVPLSGEGTINLATRQILADGTLGPITRGVIEVHDLIPPTVVSYKAETQENRIDLQFSKALDPTSAGELMNYTLSPAINLEKASLSKDGKEVILTFASALVQGTSYQLSLNGLTDTATPQKNALVPISIPINGRNIIYSLISADLPAQSVSVQLKALPQHKADPWSINCLVYTNAKPENHTIIGGFGHNSDGPTGNSRYLGVFDDGIRFWSSNQDVVTNSPLDVGRWQMLTATYDGKTVTVYKDGQPIGKKQVDLSDDDNAVINIGQTDPWDHKVIFNGSIKDFSIRTVALDEDQVKRLFDSTKQ